MPEPQPSQVNDTPQPSLRRTIGPWRLLGTLGSGGMGVVYQAVHVETGIQGAVKTVRSAAPGLFDAIRREIRVLRRLRHPGIVRVVDDGVQDGVPWYAMEVLAGPTLRTWMAYGREAAAGVETTLTLPPDLDVVVMSPTEGPLIEPKGLPAERLPDVLRLLRSLCEALAFLHGEGIVHRDLKPENVFLRTNGEPVLVDFGLVARFGVADLREDLSDGAQREVGTLAYMAPEQIRGELVDARVDLYALGCILYELLTGRPPFVGSRARVIWQHLQANPLPVSALAPHLPGAFDALCTRLLAKAPGDRIGYAEDVVAALDAIGAPATPTPAPRTRDYLYRPALVGRKGHLDRLAQRLPAPGGPGGVVLIGGESGVGKTRLALELARLAGEKRIRVIRSECTPVRQVSAGDALGAAPLQPLRPALQAIADHCRGSGPEEVAEILGSRGPLLAEHEPALLPFVAGIPAVEPLGQVAAARLRLMRWMGETLTEFAKRRPLLLIIDDLHWADDVTISFLDAVAQGTVPLEGILVVGTWRTEHSAALASLPDRPSVTTQRLDALATEDVRALVADMLAFADPPVAVVDALVRLSGGNPFYVGEYLHVAVARGVLTRAEGRWRLGAIDPLASLPTTLPELLDARYDALDADARRLLDAAAVVVGEATADVLGEVAELEADALLDATRVLLFRKILEEADPGRYRVAHGRIREGAYARMSPEARSTQHRRAAGALESRQSDDWVDLAHHWQQAGEDLRALPWLRKAGQRAWRAGAPREARRLLEEAFGIETRRGIDHDADLDRASLDVTYGQVLHALGEMSSAANAARRALVRLGHPVPSTQVGWVLRAVWEIFRQVVGLRRRAAPDPTTQREFLLAMRAANTIERSSLVDAQPLVTIAAGVTAMGFADRAGPTSPVVHGYTGPAATCGLLGLDTPFRRLLARGREAAVRSGADLQLVALSETFVCACRGHWDRAAEAAAEGIEAARRIADDYTLTQIEMALAVGLLGRGDLAGTMTLGKAVVERARRGGYGVEEMYGRLAVVGALVDQGRFVEATEALAEVDRLREEVRQEAASTTALATRALILARTHRDDARALLDDVRRRLESERTANPSYIIAFRRAVEAALALGDLATARSALKGLKRQARLQPPGRSAAKRFEAELCRQEGRVDRAVTLLRQALAQAVALSQPFDEARAAWDLGQLVPASEQIALRERAGSLFETLGVVTAPGPDA